MQLTERRVRSIKLSKTLKVPMEAAERELQSAQSAMIDQKNLAATIKRAKPPTITVEKVD